MTYRWVFAARSFQGRLGGGASRPRHSHHHGRGRIGPGTQLETIAGSMSSSIVGSMSGDLEVAAPGGGVHVFLGT